jgi:hypothetical protein
MKKNKNKMLIPMGILAFSLLLSADSFSQTRKLSDGTIVYKDGTKKLPNGTVIYKDETKKEKSTAVNLPGGKVIFPDGSGKSRESRMPDRRNNGKWLPPGQAKKIYGGSAKSYAPGQLQRWKNEDKDGREDKSEHKNNGRGKGHKA